MWAVPIRGLHRPGLASRAAPSSDINEKIHKLFHTRARMDETMMFGETCAVSLSVELPRAMAVEVEEVQKRDPEILRRILMYGLTRRAIYEGLSGQAVTER